MKLTPLLPILLGGISWLAWVGTGAADIPMMLLGLGVLQLDYRLPRR